MLKHFKIILLLFLGFLFSDCATMLSGFSQTIAITTYPTGATVYIDSLNKGDTPIIVILSRKYEHVVQIKLTGYEKYTTTIFKNINYWTFLNLVFLDFEKFFPLMVTVDYFLGGMFNLHPESINVTLQKSETTSIDNQNKLLNLENK